MGAGIILPYHTRDRHGWERIETPVAVQADTFIHRDRLLSAFRSRDNGRWHLSVAHRDRIPTWFELGFARDCLVPADVWMVVPHPPRRFWVNVNPHVLHLWEVRDQPLQDIWRADGQQAQALGFGTPDDGNGIPG